MKGSLSCMLIGCAGASTADGSQSLELQRDGLCTTGVESVEHLPGFASGMPDDRPCLDEPLRKEDVLVVWKRDRHGLILRALGRHRGDPGGGSR